MRKRVAVILLVLTIAWNYFPCIYHAEDNTTESSSQTNNSNNNKEIESIKKDLKEIKDDDELKKEDLYQALLDREKDVSSSLYNFTMFFIAVIALIVSVGVIYFAKVAKDLNTHQKKIDLVLDSSTFDQKVVTIEETLARIRFNERLNIKKNSERIIKNNIRVMEKIILTMDVFVEAGLASDTIKNFLNQSDYEYIKISLSELKDTFNTLSQREMTPLDDEDDSFVNLEEEYQSMEIDSELLFNKLDEIQREIDRMQNEELLNHDID